MGILAAVIIGLVAGALAKLLMPGRQGGGIIATMLLGMAGALVASVFGHAAGWYRSPDQGPGILAATIGAFVILAIYGILTRRRGILH